MHPPLSHLPPQLPPHLPPSLPERRPPHADRRLNPSHNATWRVTGAVVLAHVGVIWLVSQGWLTTPTPVGTTDHVIMASVVTQAPTSPVSSLVASPVAPLAAPAAKPQAPSRPSESRPAPQRTAKTQAPASAQPHSPMVSPATTAPLSNLQAAQRDATTSTATANAATAATSQPRPGPAPAAPAVWMPPSTDADYLNNPAPVYPRMSQRMGEQGTVVIRVFISTEGRAEKAEVRTSSGYARLDETALTTVQRWRFVPGQRAGVPEAMWFNVPIRFVLD